VDRATSSVTVITPTVAGREAMLRRALDSVKAQTIAPNHVMWRRDVAQVGHGAHVRNEMIFEADTEWIACLDDDDWWLPNHLELLLDESQHVRPLSHWLVGKHRRPADVVVALYEHSDGSPPVGGHHCDYRLLEGQNWFHPSACLLRRSSVVAVGGFPDPRPPLWDDWALWVNLLRAGATFACVHEVTSIKAVHPGNISRA